MTNQEALENAARASVLSYSSQIGIMTSLHLRKNNKIKDDISKELEEIGKIAAEKKQDAEASKKEYLDKEFEGNLFMVSIDQIGDVKGESIPLTNGHTPDAKILCEQLIGKVIIVPTETN